MPYAEGSSYITHAELSTFLGSGVVADVFADSAASLAHRSAASAVLDEFAAGAGLAVPLESGHLTYAMKRRVALVAMHMGASDLAPQHRDENGRGPYHAQHDQALAELAQWQGGVRAMPHDAEAEAPRETTFYTTSARRVWRRR